MSCFGKCFKNGNIQNDQTTITRGNSISNLRQIRVHNFEDDEKIRENGSSIPEKMARRIGKINVRLNNLKAP